MKIDIESSSVKQMLSSHLSIYNALNNPDLDEPDKQKDKKDKQDKDLTFDLKSKQDKRELTESSSNKDQSNTKIKTSNTKKAKKETHIEPLETEDEASPSPKFIDTPRFSPDLDSSISAWHAINGSDLNSYHEKRSNSPFQALRHIKNPPPTSSILSITTDEDIDLIRDSTVILPSKIMVFETDEEDEDEGIKRNSFIMPVMSVSDNLPSNFNAKPFQITVLSSHLSYKFETNELIRNIETDLDYINISHFNASDRKSLKNSAVVKNSDLVFIVNDGSKSLVDYMSQIFQNSAIVEEHLPKLTIINMMPVNYFINLFDLINNLKPYQIWKTSSLKQEKLVNKLKNFIELEVNKSEECSQLSRKDKNLSLTLASNNYKTRSRTMYSSLISNKKPNYKSIEKLFKLDLSASSSFEDPLRISHRFHHLNVLFSVAKKMLSSMKSKSKEFLLIETEDGTKLAFSSNFWLVCSFTVGIGIGVLASSGKKSILPILYVQDGNPIVQPKVQTQPADSTMKFLLSCVDKLKNMSIFKEYEYYSRVVSKKLSYTSSLAMEGLEKVTGLILYASY